MQKIRKKIMKTTIHDFLPKEISDETAYHLVNFFMDLAAALDSYYFVQMRRYEYDNNNDNDDNNF
jgi:hypothetical protein